MKTGSPVAVKQWIDVGYMRSFFIVPGKIPIQKKNSSAVSLALDPVWSSHFSRLIVINDLWAVWLCYLRALAEGNYFPFFSRGPLTTLLIASWTEARKKQEREKSFHRYLWKKNTLTLKYINLLWCTDLVSVWKRKEKGTACWKIEYGKESPFVCDTWNK